MDVAQLTDVELRETLKDHGVNVGPIVASTRKVYEKKLLKLIANDDSRNNSTVGELNGSVPQSNGRAGSFSPVFRNNKSPTPAPVVDEVPADSANETSDSDYEGEESMRFLTEEEIAADRAAARRGKNQKTGIFGSILAFSFVFVLLSVFVYFVLENAEQIKKLTEPKTDDVV